MKKLILVPKSFWDFETTATEAKKMANDNNCLIEFTFNKVICEVNKRTNIGQLLKTYRKKLLSPVN